MENSIKALFWENPKLEDQIVKFCAQDPEYVQAEQQFYETAHQIAQIVGYDLYDTFEQRFGAYLARSADTYYRFGLGLRQEVLSALTVR